MEPVSFTLALLPVIQLADTAITKLRRYKKQFKFARRELQALEHDTSDFSTLLFSARSNLQRLDASTQLTELESEGFTRLISRAESLVHGFVKFLLQQKRLFVKSGVGMFAFLKKFWAGRRWTAVQPHLALFKGQLLSVKGNLGLLMVIINMRMTMKLLEELSKNREANGRNIEALEYDIKLAKREIRTKTRELKELEAELMELENDESQSTIQREIRETSQVTEAVREVVRNQVPDCDPDISRTQSNLYLPKPNPQHLSIPTTLPISPPYTNESQGASQSFIIRPDSSSAGYPLDPDHTASFIIPSPPAQFEEPDLSSWVEADAVAIDSASTASYPSSYSLVNCSSILSLPEPKSSASKVVPVAPFVEQRVKERPATEVGRKGKAQQQPIDSSSTALETEAKELSPAPQKTSSSPSDSSTKIEVQKSSPAIIQAKSTEHGPAYFWLGPPPQKPSSLSSDSFTEPEEVEDDHDRVPPLELESPSSIKTQSYASHGRLDRDKLREEYFQKQKQVAEQKRLRRRRGG